MMLMEEGANDEQLWTLSENKDESQQQSHCNYPST